MCTSSWLVTALISGLVACSAGGAERMPDAEVRYLTIGADAVATAREVASTPGSLEVLEAQDGVTVIAVDATDLDPLTDAMHERHGRCGGYIVHETLDDARAALLPVAPRPPVEYTLDRPAQVAAVLPALDARQILQTIASLSGMKNRYYARAVGSQRLARREVCSARRGVRARAGQGEAGAGRDDAP